MRGNAVTKTTAAIALHLVCLNAMAQQATLTTKGLEIGGKPSSAQASGDTIRWSPNGKFFFVAEQASGFLTTLTAKGQSVGKFRTARNAQWSTEGNQLLLQNTVGLTVASADGQGKQKLVSSDAKASSACFSPDATRVAFGTKAGLAVSDLATLTSHTIVKGHPAVCSSWSREADVIAFVDDKGYLLVVRPNGTGLQQITKLDASEVEWSPNGRWLLAKTQEGWQAIQPGDHRSEPITCDSSARPTWTGGQKLMVVQAGIPRKLYLGAHDRDETGTKIAEEVRFYAAAPQIEVSNDSLTQGTFRGARRPARGDIRMTGYIETADALDGKYVIRVESTIDSTGRETVFGKSVSQPIEWAEGARQTDGKNFRSMQAGDLRDDDRVTVVSHGTSLDPASTMALREVWIEGEAIGSSTNYGGGSEYVPNIGGAPHLSSPNIEYDGITRDRVVVPMVFPVAGKCWWEDWFLAPRGGGKRRHHGQDLMGKKMTPLVACFDGVVHLGRSKGISGFSISLDGDNGYRAFYCHVNNDTPGTDDDQGGDDTAFAPGLVSGMHVKAGQFIGFLGNSGNAKTTDPHCHFEMKDRISGAIINTAPSLRAAIKLSAPGVQTLAGSGDSPARGRTLEQASRRGGSRRSQIGSATMAYWPIMQKYGEQYRIDPALIAAITQQESDGNPRCISRAGAMGLMQLMPENCREYAVSDPYSPEENIRGGVAQLADHLKRFGGDIEKALAAYNAGPGRVLDGSWKRLTETRNYVPKVLAYFEGLKGQPYAPPQSQTSGAKRIDQPIQLKTAAYVPSATATAAPANGSEALAKIREATPQAQQVSALDQMAQKIAVEYARNPNPKANIQRQMNGWTRQAGFRLAETVIFTTANGEKFADRWIGKHLPSNLIGIGCKDMGGIQYWAVVYAK